MKKVSKAKVIAKAFLKDKRKRPDWHNERLAICETCPLNSKNSEHATLIDKIKPRCSACGCFIMEKTSQETEMCGKAEIGEEPLWYALKVETASSDDLDMINLSPDKINVDLDKDYYHINYGDIKVGADSSVKLQFTSKYEINPVSVKSTCGCTTPTMDSIDNNTIEVGLGVRTKKVSRIVSTVSVFYNSKGQEKNVKIRVKANVIE